MMNDFTLQPIGHAQTPFDEKFGIPRQAVLTNSVSCQLHLTALPLTAVEGIEQFSHLWVLFWFHQTAANGWHPRVRPPRLGGNQRIGVLATRSTHRPNPVGMSCVELLAVDSSSAAYPILQISGIDLVNRTPIIDVKPYIPYSDAIADARAGYAQQQPQVLEVCWRPEALQQAQPLGESFVRLVNVVLSEDPRPAYHQDPTRIYGVSLHGHNVRFCVAAQVEVLSVD